MRFIGNTKQVILACATVLVACSSAPTTPPPPVEPEATYKTLWSLVRVLHVGADHVVVRDFAEGFAGFEIHDVTKQIWYLRRERSCPNELWEYPQYKLGEDVLMNYVGAKSKYDRCDPPPASVPEKGWVRLDDCEQVKIIDVFTGENLPAGPSD